MTRTTMLHPTQQIDPDAPAIRIRGLRKAYGEVEVLHGIDLDVEPGQVVCVIGPSGSGKSTLLRCVNRLEEPSSGTIEIEGIDITDPETEVDVVRSRIGMVFQSFNLFTHMNVLRNLTVAQVKVLGRGRAEAEKVARENLERVGLGHRADAHPTELSGGQAQRVAIARALSMNPDMMVVTHEMGFAREVGDHLVFMADGASVEQGDPRTVLSAPQEERTRDFLARVL
ncbi:amino acid ABC transporter ATP-binding protein, PAAT family [Kytococcus aerolatus]|uniref:Amino acid ABC transporter ATP-binding protein, PAAT family n=1 Tax=Kytococcus aerolatus TaxID=592308 RepID=A0A212U1Y4_9MICO|nr:amino acid ABC transporter ATP-binding protein [Kytococcus aerolatus]SNC72275.1 amino acid ABC transporter ATP-binding protein, PAAT family [Kytococcus aerolatus]